MGIFSSIGNFFGGIGRGIVNAFSGGSSQSASALQGITPAPAPVNMSVVPKGGQTLAPNISTPQGIGQTQPNGSITLLTKTGQPTGSTIGSNGVGYTPVPSTYTAPLTITARTAGNIVSPGSLTTKAMSIDSLSAPSTLSATGGDSSGASTLSVPSASSVVSTNPGLINNSGLIDSMKGTHSYDASTNTFTSLPPPQTPEEAAAAGRQSTFEKLLGKLPKKDNVYASPEVMAAQQARDSQQAVVNDYTSQLNSIVAKQNADLLQLRQTGSQEGVTEAVYGGQEATVNREAAIRALPVQAALSAAQGNLSLANDYLTQVTKIKTEDVDNDYNYKKSYFDAVSQFAQGEDKIKLEELKTKNDRTYQERRDNINSQDSWARLAVTQKQPQLVTQISALDPSSPNFAKDLAKITKGITPPADSTGSTLEERQASALSQFSQAFTPGRKLANGIPTVDSSGQITPEAWKAAIADAPAEGLTRESFIKAFGNMILGGKGDAISDKYGLTPKEKDLVLTQ